MRLSERLSSDLDFQGKQAASSTFVSPSYTAAPWYDFANHTRLFCFSCFFVLPVACSVQELANPPFLPRSSFDARVECSAPQYRWSGAAKPLRRWAFVCPPPLILPHLPGLLTDWRLASLQAARIPTRQNPFPAIPEWKAPGVVCLPSCFGGDLPLLSQSGRRMVGDPKLGSLEVRSRQKCVGAQFMAKKLRPAPCRKGTSWEDPPPPSPPVPCCRLAALATDRSSSSRIRYRPG